MSAKNTKQTSSSTEEYDGPPVEIEFRELGGWGFGNFMNPFASLIGDSDSGKKKDKKLKLEDKVEADYPVNDYGVAEYDYYDEDVSEDYEGNLEGFNITLFENGSEAVRRVNAAVL